MTTYDENKRQLNIVRHGIDFLECESIFSAPLRTWEDNRAPYGEQRFRSLGLLRARVVMLVWTERGGVPHLISCRYGERHEIKRYFAEIQL